MKLFQGDVEKIVRRVVDYGLNTAFVAGQFGVTQRRVQQLVKQYRETGEVPVLRCPGRELFPSLKTFETRFYGRRLSLVLGHWNSGLLPAGKACGVTREKSARISTEFA